MKLLNTCRAVHLLGAGICKVAINLELIASWSI